MALVQEPVDERRRHDLVAEHVSPFLEALVRGQHRRRPLVPGVDQLAVLADRQVADLVDDEQRGSVSTRSRRDSAPAALASMSESIRPANVP